MKVVKLSKYAMVSAMLLSFLVAAFLVVMLYEKENIVKTLAGDDDPGQTLNLSKTVDEKMVFAGTTVTYTYEITNNTRAYTINSIQLVDSELGNISCPSNTLSPGESMTCTDTAVINQTTTNIATVSGIQSDEPGTQVSDTETETVNVLPNIVVTKEATPSNLTEDGTVSYTVTVTNPSNDNGPYTFEFTSLEDDPHYADLFTECPLDEVSAILSPGESFVCTYDAVITCDDEPSLTDTATATGYAAYSPGPDQQDIVTVMTGSDSATVNIACEEPSIVVTKTADPTSITADTEVDYQVSITNNIGLNATLNTLTDDIYGNLDGQGDCKTGDTINDGATYTCNFPGEVTCEDEPSLTDTVTAELTYTDESGVEYTISDTASATVAVACEDEATCGDGNLDSGEECDDGNTTNGDGCSAQCTTEEDGEEPGEATIHGKVYNDANQNQTLDVGESGITGVTVALLNNGGTTLSTDQTDSNGDFSFDELDPGTYGLTETDLAEYMSSTTNNITGIVIAADDSSYHLFGDYMAEEEENTPTSTPTTTTGTTPTTTTPTTTSSLPTTGPGDNPYPLFATLALVPLIASGYAFYRYKRK